MKLRDYQSHAIEAVRDSYRKGCRRPLLVSPTGSGKTLMFSYISAGMNQNGKRVLILAHRRELLRQISSALRSVGVRHAVMSGGSRGIPVANVVVASVFTLARRLEYFPAPDLIIGDEAHHFTPSSTWGKCVSAFPNAHVLGVTATPERLDGKGLGLMFDDMVMGPTVAELTEQGYLTPAEVYAPSRPDLKALRTRMGDYVNADLESAMDKPSITGNAVHHYRKLADGKLAIAFCVSVKHAKDVAEEFRHAGYNAAHIDGGMEEHERDRVLKDFAAGKIKILTSCDLVSEGFDLPAVEVAILLRPTKSLALYLQQVGRAIRPSPGKTTTIVLDHAGNTAVHGFIDEHREWILTSDSARKKREGEKPATVRTCPQCFAMHRPSPACPKCGHVYKVVSRKIREVEGELVQMNRASETQISAQDWQRQFQILVGIAKNRKYAHPEKWAFHVICGKEASRLAKTRGAPGKTTNGLTLEERNRIWAQTVGKRRAA
jgi:DNA repair protein RadD